MELSEREKEKAFKLAVIAAALGPGAWTVAGFAEALRAAERLLDAAEVQVSRER